MGLTSCLWTAIAGTIAPQRRGARPISIPVAEPPSPRLELGVHPLDLCGVARSRVGRGAPPESADRHSDLGWDGSSYLLHSLFLCAVRRITR